MLSRGKHINAARCQVNFTPKFRASQSSLNVNQSLHVLMNTLEYLPDCESFFSELLNAIISQIDVKNLPGCTVQMLAALQFCS